MVFHHIEENYTTLSRQTGSMRLRERESVWMMGCEMWGFVCMREEGEREGEHNTPDHVTNPYFYLFYLLSFSHPLPLFTSTFLPRTHIILFTLTLPLTLSYFSSILSSLMFPESPLSIHNSYVAFILFSTPLSIPCLSLCPYALPYPSLHPLYLPLSNTFPQYAPFLSLFSSMPSLPSLHPSLNIPLPCPHLHSLSYLLFPLPTHSSRPSTPHPNRSPPAAPLPPIRGYAFSRHVCCSGRVSGGRGNTGTLPWIDAFTRSLIGLFILASICCFSRTASKVI